MGGLAALGMHVRGECAILNTEIEISLKPKPWRMRRWRGGGREAAQYGVQGEASSMADEQTEWRIRRLEAALSAAQSGLQGLLREAAGKGSIGIIYHADSDQRCCTADAPSEITRKEEFEKAGNVCPLADSRRAFPPRPVSCSSSSSESLPTLDPPTNEFGSLNKTVAWLPRVVRERMKRPLLDLDEGQETDGLEIAGDAKRVRFE